jgi:hypothetical protein
MLYSDNTSSLYKIMNSFRKVMTFKCGDDFEKIINYNFLKIISEKRCDIFF